MILEMSLDFANNVIRALMDDDNDGENQCFPSTHFLPPTLRY
jgi:hypothetical protein